MKWREQTEEGQLTDSQVHLQGYASSNNAASPTEDQEFKQPPAYENILTQTITLFQNKQIETGSYK